MFYSCVIEYTFHAYPHSRIHAFHCSTAPPFHRFTVSLFHCFTVSLFKCNTWRFGDFGYDAGRLCLCGLEGLIAFKCTIYLIHVNKSWKVRVSFSEKHQIGGVKKPRSSVLAYLLGFGYNMDRIAKYSGLKKRALEMRSYLSGLSNEIPQFLNDGTRNISTEREEAKKVSSELSACANYLVFNHYYTIDQLRLSKAITCKKHLLCPFCAARRAAKQVEKNGDRIRKVLEENKNLIPVMITLTVKNGEDLEERILHLQKAFKKLQQKRKDALRGKTETEFTKVTGSIFSYEVTNKGNGWHPHIHMIALLDDFVDQGRLSREWEAITKDSKIVDIRKITSKTGNNLDISDALLEVFKYAVKFHDLDLELTWEAYRILKGKRLLGSFGTLYGTISEPESLLDDLLDDLPYVEMFYKFSKLSSSYELQTALKKEAVSSSDNIFKEKEVVQKTKIVLSRPENPLPKDVLIPRPQIRGIKPKLSRLDQYLADNPLPD